MGWGIRQMLIEKVIETPQNKVLSEEDQKAIQEALEKQVAGLDFTGLALKTLETEFFERALLAIETFEDQPLVRAQLLHATGQTLHNLGFISLSQTTLQEALELYEQHLGPLHQTTLTAINDVESIYLLYRDFQKAKELIERAYEGRKSTLGELDPVTLLSLHNLAAIYAYLGNYQKSLEILQDLLIKQTEVLGPLNIDTLATLNTTGSVYAFQSKHDLAIEFFRRALDGRRETLNGHHPDIVNSLNNLGNSYHNLGKSVLCKFRSPHQ